MMEDLIKYHRDAAGPGHGPGTISDWSDMTIVHFIPKGEDMTGILYDYHVLRIPNVLITGDCNLMVGCESDMSFAVVLGKRYVPDDCKDDDELMNHVWEYYVKSEDNILEKCFPNMSYTEFVAHTLMKLGVHKIERDEQNEKFDERVLLDKIKELADKNPPIDFLNTVHDIDDVNYNHVLYYMDDKTIAPDIYKRLKDDLLVSHMYNWEDNILSHIPAFYIENADLQYIDYWDPNALDTLLENGTIKEVRRITCIIQYMNGLTETQRS